MSFDANTQARVAAMITAYGFAVTIKRGTASVFKGSACYEAKMSQWAKADKEADVSQVISGSATVYVPGNVKTAPQPGDILTSATDSYIVMSVEAIQPANLAMAYKLVLQ